MKVDGSLEGTGITVENDDILLIAGGLYVKTPEALERLFGDLRKIGYEIKDCRKDSYRDGTSVEQQKEDGWSLWYASLNGILKGKCGSCGKIVSHRGIRAHGRTCEHCGAVLYRHIVDGSTVNFVFTKQRVNIGTAHLVMKAKRWDHESGYLYLYRRRSG